MEPGVDTVVRSSLIAWRQLGNAAGMKLDEYKEEHVGDSAFKVCTVSRRLRTLAN